MTILRHYFALDLSDEKKIRQIEYATAIILTVLSVVLHSIFLSNSHALWRDEVNSFGQATMPTLADLWTSLRYDSSPVLWPFLMRLWIYSGAGDSDFSLRVLGFLVQMLLLGALWFNATVIGKRAPILAVFLVGFQPAIILWPSLRSYGLGAALILFTLGCLWLALENPSPRRVMIAMLLAVLSVQCLYVNTVFLGAICMAGAIVFWRRKQWRRSLFSCAIFLFAALSLLPYIPTLRYIARWQGITTESVGAGDILTSFGLTLANPAFELFLLWFFVGAFVMFPLVRRLRTIYARGNGDIQSAVRPINDIGTFVLFVSVLVTVTYYLFLQFAGRHPYPWHFVGVIGLLACCLDSLWSFAIINPRTRIVLATILSVLAFIFFPTFKATVTVRRTNVDAIAARLHSLAQSGDLVVITPFYYGITYKRYNKSTAPWITAPDIRDMRVHRYDRLKDLMTAPHSLERVEDQIVQTLKAGRRVWLMGVFPSPPLQKPYYLHPEIYGAGGWYCPRYEQYCAKQIAYFIHNNAVIRKKMTSPPPVSNFENGIIEVAEGLKTTIQNSQLEE